MPAASISTANVPASKAPAAATQPCESDDLTVQNEIRDLLEDVYQQDAIGNLKLGTRFC